MKISEVSFFSISIRISQLKDLKSFAIVLDTLRSTLSSCPASFTSASSSSSSSINYNNRSRDRDRSNGGIGGSHRVTSTLSQGMTMSLGVLVAIRQLQRACKVLTNMILFAGYHCIAFLPLPLCFHHLNFLFFYLSFNL